MLFSEYKKDNLFDMILGTFSLYEVSGIGLSSFSEAPIALFYSVAHNIYTVHNNLTNVYFSIFRLAYRQKKYRHLITVTEEYKCHES